MLLGAITRLDVAAAATAGGLLHCMRLDEALTKRWDTDAWVVPYRLSGVSNLKAGWPRFRQAALADVRAKGADIVATMFVLDFDLPKVDGNKQRWTDALLDAFLLKFEEAIAAGFELASQWTAFYTTNHGARMIFVLDEALAVESYKPYMRGLIALFAQAGIPIEGTLECLDWTHLFRLPHVVDERYGEATQPRVFEIRPENRLRLEAITPIGPDDAIGLAIDGHVERNPRPDENAVAELLTDSFKTLAKKWLRGHACYSALFEHAKIAPVGRRDATLTSYVGDAVNQLFPRANVTKEHIYALFYESVATTLEPDSETRDWHEKTWDLIERFWSKTTEEHQQYEQATQHYLLTVEERKRQVLQGMREWCSDPRLHSEIEAEALAFMESHLIAMIGDMRFCMTANGRYDNIPIKDRAVPARVRELGMDSIIQLDSITKEGTLKQHPTEKLMRHYGTIVGSLQAQIGDFGGWISNIETEDACLNIKTFSRRTDITPLFNESVDEWLRLVGGRDYEKLCRWLGLALAFDKGAICALALIGAPGAGKKMLIEGLAEAITTRTFVDAADMFTSFNEGLLKSPIINADENWPSGSNPADFFRRVVGGNTNTVKKKFMDNTKLVSPLRLILTANSDDIVLDLAGKRDLTRYDQEAIEIRLFVVKVGEAVKNWLRERGGHEFTNGWIRGDGGQPSKWILARHFLHLYEKHKEESDPRFLVEGSMTEELAMSFRTHGVSIAPVVETLLVMVEGLEKQKDYKCCAVDNGNIYVTSTEVLTQFRNSVGRLMRTDLSIRKIQAALVSLNSRQTASIALHSKPQAGKQRWYELDLKLLLRIAERDGRSVPLLSRLVEGAPIMKMPLPVTVPSLPPIPKFVPKLSPA